MAAFRSTVVIDRPLDEVFAFAIQQEVSARWQPNVLVRHVAGQPNAAGSTYQRTWQSASGERYVHTYELSVVAPPNRFQASSIEGAPPFVYDYTFVAEDGGTQVFVDVDSEIDSEEEVQHRLEDLKNVLEGEVEARSAAADAVASERRAARAGDDFRRAFIWTAGIAGGLSVLSMGGAAAIPLYYLWYAAGIVALAALIAALVLYVRERPNMAKGTLAGVGVSILALSATCFVNLSTLDFN